MTTAEATVQLSPDEIERLQEEPGVSLVNGHILKKPMSRDSARVGSKINFLLRKAIGDTGSAEVFDQTLGYQCFPDDPGGFRKPDISVIRSERLLKEDEGLMRIPPDLAVEVPSDRVVELEEKINEYLVNGFPLVWIVFPRTRKVVIYRPGSDPQHLQASDEITGGSAVPEFRSKVADFFS